MYYYEHYYKNKYCFFKKCFGEKIDSRNSFFSGCLFEKCIKEVCRIFPQYSNEEVEIKAKNLMCQLKDIFDDNHEDEFKLRLLCSGDVEIIFKTLHNRNATENFDDVSFYGEVACSIPGKNRTGHFLPASSVGYN